MSPYDMAMSRGDMAKCAIFLVVKNVYFHEIFCAFSNPKLVSCLSDSDRHETQLGICLDEYCIGQILWAARLVGCWNYSSGG